MSALGITGTEQFQRVVAVVNEQKAVAARGYGHSEQVTGGAGRVELDGGNLIALRRGAACCRQAPRRWAQDEFLGCGQDLELLTHEGLPEVFDRSAESQDKGPLGHLRCTVEPPERI